MKKRIQTIKKYLDEINRNYIQTDDLLCLTGIDNEIEDMENEEENIIRKLEITTNALIRIKNNHNETWSKDVAEKALGSLLTQL